MPDPTEVMDADALREVYSALLVPSFPPAELLPVDWLIDGVASGAVSVLLIEDESGPVAAAVTERLEPSPARLLTYFVTRADRRGRGMGSALYRTMLAALIARDHPPLVVAEVERPDRHAASVAYGDPSARLRFYGRHGARALDLPYFQPAIGDADPVHGMLLLALHVDEDLVGKGVAGAGAALPGPGLVAGVIDAILGEAGDGEPAETACLRAAARRPTVALLDAGDYGSIPVSL